jgi:predicted DNA-binding protein (UPF0251 family)
MTDLDTVELELGELEALRLCDLVGLDQEGAGQRMGVSRGTVQRLLKRARAKVVGCLVDTQALVIRRDLDHASLHPDGE